MSSPVCRSDSPRPTAAKKKPPACPGARYVVDTAEPLGPLGPAGIPGFPDVIEVGANGSVRVESSCPAIEGKVRGSRKGDKVNAKWKKEICAELQGKVKLKLKLDPSCEFGAGKFRAKKHKVKFTVTRPPAVTPELEPLARVAATVGPAGGSVSATGSDGVAYTLDVPEFALTQETEIALTPVAAIPDLPFSGGLAGGVEFEPDGLALLRTATLRIEVPTGFVPAEGTSLVGFGSRSGEGFHARIATDDAGVIRVPVLHFSGAGAGGARPAELQELVSRQTSFADALWNAVSAANPDPTALATVLRDAYQIEIRPRLLAAATSDVRLDSEIANFAQWIVMIQLSEQVPALTNEIDEGLSLAADALTLGIRRANLRCTSSFDPLLDAATAIRWQRIAEALFNETGRGADLEIAFLDRASVHEELCVEVTLEELTFPDVPPVGEASELVIRAGYTVGGEVRPPPSMRITVTPISGIADASPFSVDPDPELTTLLTSTGAGPVRVDVKACLLDSPLLADVCAEGSIDRLNFVLLPPLAILGPGESQQFTVDIDGEPVANPPTGNSVLVWTATGGSIDQDGLYSAGLEQGSFEVTASHIPTGVSETAAVTVFDPDDPDPDTFCPGADPIFCPDRPRITGSSPLQSLPRVLIPRGSPEFCRACPCECCACDSDPETLCPIPNEATQVCLQEILSAEP